MGLLLLLVLSGCGRDSLAQRVSANNSVFDEVLVVELTPATVQRANAAPYQPRRLPAAFSPQGIQTQRALTRAPGDWPTDRQVAPYKIGVGDVLGLVRAPDVQLPSVGAERATTSQETLLQVEASGQIDVTELGPVRVEDLTLSEARDVLRLRFVEAQIDPRFELSVREFNARRASVSGAVTQPIVIPLQIAPLTFAEALALAGDIDVRDGSGVQLALTRGDQEFAVDLETFRSSSRLRRGLVRNGDQIVVRADDSRDATQLVSEEDRRRDSDVRSRFEQSQEFGAVDQDYVYIAGEVEQQRRFPLPFETRATLADALFDGSNGVSSGVGNPGEIYVIRSLGPDRIVAYHLSANNAVNLTLATLTELRPNDMIFVAERPIATWNRVLQSVFPSPVISLARGI
ncbi:MAG: polysaccharide biosynthesis/export family protein [Pseudomonadota bacterium]